MKLQRISYDDISYKRTLTDIIYPRPVMLNRNDLLIQFEDYFEIITPFENVKPVALLGNRIEMITGKLMPKQYDLTFAICYYAYLKNKRYVTYNFDELIGRNAEYEVLLPAEEETISKVNDCEQLELDFWRS